MTELKNQNAQFPDAGIDSDGGTWFDLEEEEIELEEEEVIQPFDPTKIRVDSRPLTIDLVLRRIEYDELDLAPDFQRRAGIWTNAAKSRLIESILIRIPLPAFYMDATNEDKWLVIDGLQRLTALKQFVTDKQLTLSGLEFLTNLKGKTYDELPRNFQRRILETQLTVYLIEKGTPPEVKFNIFRRINTGGLPLSPQELRHALNPGKATKFLSRLADFQEFKQATGITYRRRIRMEEQEFVLRFLAFTLTSYKEYKVQNRDLFLNDTLVNINKMSNQELKLIEDRFKRAMVAAFNIFGKYAFRKISKENIQKNYPLNKALFEAWSVNLSNLNEQELQTLNKRKQELIDKFVNLIETDKEFRESISQATNKVKYRFSTLEKLIKEVLT